MRYMNRLLQTVLVLALLSLALPALGAGLPPEEILDKIDENAYAERVEFAATMTIINRGREITKEIVARGISDTHSLVEFTNTRDRGTRYLKIHDELWMRFPDTEEIVKISGHMLRQGMMGSDFSYEDALESSKMRELYEAKVVGEESVNGHDCYVLELNLRPGQEAAYPTRKFWVDQAHFFIWKDEMYAESGKLVKVSRTLAVEEVDGRFIPTETVMENLLRKGSQTRMKIHDIRFGGDFTEADFSLQALTRR